MNEKIVAAALEKLTKRQKNNLMSIVNMAKRDYRIKENGLANRFESMITGYLMALEDAGVISGIYPYALDEYYKGMIKEENQRLQQEIDSLMQQIADAKRDQLAAQAESEAKKLKKRPERRERKELDIGKAEALSRAGCDKRKADCHAHCAAYSAFKK